MFYEFLLLCDFYPKCHIKDEDSSAVGSGMDLCPWAASTGAAGWEEGRAQPPASSCQARAEPLCVGKGVTES